MLDTIKYQIKNSVNILFRRQINFEKSSLKELKLNFCLFLVFLYACSGTYDDNTPPENQINLTNATTSSVITFTPNTTIYKVNSYVWKNSSINIANLTQTYFEVLWKDPESLDRIKYYEFYLNNQLLIKLEKENDDNSIFISNLKPRTKYNLKIVAYDHLGNKSTYDNNLNVTTLSSESSTKNSNISRTDFGIKNDVVNSENIVKYQDLINKSYKIKIPKKINFQIGEILKFVKGNRYISRISIPYSFQSGRFRTFNNIIYEKLEQNEDFNLELKALPKSHILNVHVFNVSGTLVAEGYEIINENIINSFKCFDEKNYLWKGCGDEITKTIKEGITFHQDLEIDTDLVEYTYKLGSDLGVGFKNDKEDLYLCEKLNVNTECNLILNKKGSGFFIPILNNDKLILFLLDGSMYIYDFQTKKTLPFTNTNFEIKRNNQFYFKELYLNKLILGHYDTGGLMELTPLNRLKLINQFDNSRELQSFGSIDGHQIYGTWPFGKLYIVSEENLKVINLFPQNNRDYISIVTDNFDHLDHNILGRRVTTIVPCFEGICIATGNKNFYKIETDDIEKLYSLSNNYDIDLDEYGLVYYMKGSHQVCGNFSNEISEIFIEFKKQKFIIHNKETECEFDYPYSFDSVEFLNPFLVNNGANYVNVEK